MNFAFTEEQEELRSFIRSFMEDKSAETAVRELMDTDDGYDPAVWSQMAEQLGLQSMIIPEEYGGQGFGYVELGIAVSIRPPLAPSPRRMITLGGSKFPSP